EVRDRESCNLRARWTGRDVQDHGERKGRRGARANRARPCRDSRCQCAGSAEGGGKAESVRRSPAVALARPRRAWSSRAIGIERRPMMAASARTARPRKKVRSSLLKKRRELRALIGNKHRDQLRGFSAARISRDQMSRTWRLEERLSDLEGFERAAAELRAYFALGDVGGDGPGMAMPARKSARPIKHPHD